MAKSPRPRALQPGRAALCNARRVVIRSARSKHSARELPRAPRQMLGVRNPDLVTLSSSLKRSPAYFPAMWRGALASAGKRSRRCAFVWAMLALAFIDLDTFYLPDDITLSLIWAGLLVNTGGMFVDLQSAVLGAAGGYIELWSVYWIYKLATGKEGMGYGDFKLLAAIGAWLGWKMLPVVILLSSFVGAVVGIALIVFARHGRNVPIPFGPYLVLGGLSALLWGDALIKYYLQIV